MGYKTGPRWSKKTVPSAGLALAAVWVPRPVCHRRCFRFLVVKAREWKKNRSFIKTPVQGQCAAAGENVRSDARNSTLLWGTVSLVDHHRGRLDHRDGIIANLEIF